ncbi:DNA polymerase epsilon subunit C, Chrac1 [Carpediemonas membranifera]|uniref:DNA polymerase epsilon subunit C, Chrac1 n=1 Tax=Carpediemonas membranifera TaxID=201153 RepID=A0A8J6BAA0_9EUKA|nr:DNA polymerase epsilon subunit C, Chrac1 [Carpediemonas membranifera]|eukprot:KAG9397399.1 DNA polymerase epsilon subunit C, Chrac1 [Carpediemonas membranifera]
MGKESLFLPITRTDNILKSDPDFPPASRDTIALITRATELFVQELSKSAGKNTKARGAKTLSYDDVANVVANDSRFAFLNDEIPRTQPYKGPAGAPEHTSSDKK